MIPIDNRNLVMHPRRRRTTAHFPDFDENFNLSIDAILATFETDLEADETGANCVLAVHRIFEHRLLAEVISMPEFAPLKQKLADISTLDARAFLREIQSLPCAEAAVVDWSPELTHATCSNTAPYHLGAGKTALAAMFYLVKYLKKEAGSPNTALAVLIDARDHINEYGSKGPDAGTPQHFARHLLSRCVNKSDQELSGTQSASVVLGFDSFRCSETTGFVDNYCALLAAKEMWLASGGGACTTMVDVEEHGEVIDADEDEQPECLLDSNDEDERDDEKDRTGDDVPRKKHGATRVFDSEEDDDDTGDDTRPPSSKIYTVPKKGSVLKRAVAVSQNMNYRYRGRALQLLNYVEYCNMVSIEKYKARTSRNAAAAVDKEPDEGGDEGHEGIDTSDQTLHQQQQLRRASTETCGPGRKASKSFDFDHDHPLCKHYVQKLREKFIVPIRAGGARPTFPPPLKVGESPSSAWIKQHDDSAAFYSANFVSWSDTEVPNLSAAKFRVWVHDQHLTAKDEVSNSFATRLIALGRLQEFRNYAFLNQLSKDDLKMNKQYRQRNRRMWTEEELEEYFKLCGGAEGKKSADDAVEKLRKRQEARKTDVRRLEAAETNDEWITNLTDDTRTLLGSTGSIPETNLVSLQRALHHTHLSPTAADVMRASTHLYKASTAEDSKEDGDPDDDGLDGSDEEGENGDDPDDIAAAAAAAVDPPHDFDLDTADEDSDVPYYFDRIDQRKYPKEIARISDEQFIAAKSEWERQHKDDFKKQVFGTPRPPSNPEQRELVRRVLTQVRAAHALKPASTTDEEKVEVIVDSTAATEDDGIVGQGDIGIMVVGAPGVGKSHAVSTISFYIKHENLGIVLSSAYTGVAAIQVVFLVTALPTYSFAC